MFGFSRNKRNYPPFEVLNNFQMKDYYFIRIAEWDWLNEKDIYVKDPHGPRMFTFDAWPQLIFIAANGQMTLSEYVYFMADKYKNEIPILLDETIIIELQKLLEFKIIKFVRAKQRPEKQFELPRKNHS